MTVIWDRAVPGSTMTQATGYVYDDAFAEHDLPGHPENAERLRGTLKLLAERSVLDACVPVQARLATEAEVGSVHEGAVLDRIRLLAERGGGNIDSDTYVGPGSPRAALMAAGGAIEATSAVLSGRLRNAMCLLRPPGHHATPSRSMGFCLLNNIALAARAALRHHAVTRVLIVDFDVHHGNGTQAVFAADPSAYYMSTHQYPHYPGSGHWRETGNATGAGSVLNVPLPAGVGDAGYATVWEELLWPWASRSRPDLILVSAGYDAHWTDPLARMALSLSGYAWLQQDLIRLADELCDGRIVFVLEGGYQLEVLACGVLNALQALLSRDEFVDPLGGPPWPERPVGALVAQIRDRHGLGSC